MYDGKGRAPFGAVMLLAVAGAVAPLGCASTTATVAPSPAPLATKPARHPRAVAPTLVKLFAGHAATEPSLVLGSVTVDVRGDALQAAAALRRAAGKMGADAVLQMKLSKGGDISRTSLSGLAVRFRP